MIRVTPFSIAENASFYHRQHLAALAQLQRQVSSGVRFERPSDNPLVTAQIRSRREVASSLELQKSQIHEANLQLNQSVSNLLTVEDLLSQAQRIALTAPQELEPAARQALVTQVDSLIQRLESIVDSKNGTQYLYSGNASLVSPVKKIDSKQLAIPHFVYQGATSRASIALSQSLSVDVRYTAEQIFFHNGRGASLYFGSTGAAAGSGTDSGIGRSQLQVRHLTTSYAGTSGVQPGTNSDAGDTIIGALGSHRLTIVDTSGNGSAGTVALNGGTPVAFTNADENLEVTGPRGERVFVNTTAITAGFNGQIDAVSDGTLSVDGGKTMVKVAYTANQTLVNSITGAVTNVNSQGIWQTGNESIEYTETAGALTALYELRDDLLNTRQLDNQTLNQSFARRATDLDRAVNQVLKVIGEQSSALENLEQLTNRNAELQLEIEKTIVDIESINLADVITELQNRQSVLQFSFATFNLIQNTNILRFLG